MKRVIFCIIGWVLVLGLHAQIVENMRIYTDKDCYVAGEDLWIKVCVTDSLSRGSVLSKVMAKQPSGLCSSFEFNQRTVTKKTVTTYSFLSV